MSELKAFDVGLGRYTEDGYPCVVAFDADQNPRLLGDEKVYLKSEADKVIAELEETLNNSRNARKYWRKEYLIEYKECSYQKYKRCLAMAQEWRSLAGFYGMKASCFNHRGFGCTAEKYSRREFHAWKCVKQWLAIAKKFKEAQT